MNKIIEHESTNIIQPGDKEAYNILKKEIIQKLKIIISHVESGKRILFICALEDGKVMKAQGHSNFIMGKVLSSISTLRDMLNKLEASHTNIMNRGNKS